MKRLYKVLCGHTLSERLSIEARCGARKRSRSGLVGRPHAELHAPEGKRTDPFHQALLNQKRLTHNLTSIGKPVNHNVSFSSIN
ncbi:hypothetical protein Amal_02857 [Acetobacter malorum]|uniref:Uncharacterized protein n=1 Tax=Acetobacter malorum TaxID=178901 RepID=A0A177GA08_9PROT|nr:hypothetical protein Amal_02857 [Acetobacter malorum]